MRLLGVTQLPYHDLMIIDSKYPVLLSQKVSGKPVLRVWYQFQAFENLDPVHTGLLIIAAMLINPEDGKEDNFILSEDGKYLVPIDNDHCFLPSFFQKEGSFWNLFTVNTALQTKTILFCLDEMYKPLPLEVCRHILSIDFDKLLISWLEELDKLENKLNNLVDQNQRERFLEQGTVMRIPFYKQFIQNLHWKAHKIHDILNTVSQPTPFGLLKAVEPFAAKCYEDSFKQGYNPQTRFKAATDNLYKKTAVDGSRVSILNTRTMMEIVEISEKDLQKDAAFQKMGPLDALELLKQLIKERHERHQREQELLCEFDEINQGNIWISLFGSPPAETALKAFFANPKEGLILKGSRLLTSSKLTELFTQAPGKGTTIRFLSLSNSPVLTNKEVRLLTKECPNLEYLDVSGCIKLKEIVSTEGEWPLLARLEAKDCENLEKLSSYSPIKILRIGTLSKIKIFVEKFTLDILLISNKANQFEFSLRKAGSFEVKSWGQSVTQENFIKSILRKKEIEEGFQGINIIRGKHSISSTRDLAVFITCIDLKDFNIQAQDIQLLSLFKLTNLKAINLSRNKLSGTDSLEYLIQGDWPNLKQLDLSNNEITDKELQILARGNWPLLEILNLCMTKITTLGVGFIVKEAKWLQLKSLDVSVTKINDDILEILAHANWPLLETLDLKYIEVTKEGSFNFVLNANWPHLKKIDFSWSENSFVQSLLPKNWHRLEQLDLSSSKITQNEIKLMVEKSNWPQLKHLDVSCNFIYDKGVSTLTLAEWPLLESLNLSNIKLSTKGVEKIIHSKHSKWPQQLKHLNISNNEISNDGLSVLAIVDWPQLEELHIKNTKITSQGIEIVANLMEIPNLKKLDISENIIFDEGLKILTLGKWPLFQHLVYYETKVTQKGQIALLEDLKWPNLHHLEYSLGESLFNFNGDLVDLPSSEVIRAIVPMYYKPSDSSPVFVLVLGMNWLNSKEIYLSINKDGRTPNMIMVPLDKWNRFQYIQLRLYYLKKIELPQSLVWPANLKNLDASYCPFADECKLESLLIHKCPLLEELCLWYSEITVKSIEILVKKSDWPNLKKLNISHNNIQNKGLEILSSGNWPLLEYLDLERTNIILDNLETFVHNASWPNLKEIYLQGNIRHSKKAAIKAILFKKWPNIEAYM